MEKLINLELLGDVLMLKQQGSMLELVGSKATLKVYVIPNDSSVYFWYNIITHDGRVYGLNGNTWEFKVKLNDEDEVEEE